MFEQLLDGIRAVGLPDPATASPVEMLQVASVLHRLEAAISAYSHAYAAAVLAWYEDDDRPIDTHPVRAIDPWDQAEAELSAALPVTKGVASRMIAVGTALSTRLPKVAAAFARGDLDLARVRIIVDASANVDPDLIGEVERRILAGLRNSRSPLTGARLRNMIDTVIAHVDADGLRIRREAAVKGRHLWIGPGPDGMAELAGSLPAADAVYVTGRLTELAKGVCRQDPRSFDARRADALTALSHGQSVLACQCGKPNCPYADSNRKPLVPRKPLVHVIANAATVDGSADTPGWLNGYGIIDAQYVRDITADGAIVRPIVEPSGGTLVPAPAPSGDEITLDRTQSDVPHTPEAATPPSDEFSARLGESAVTAATAERARSDEPDSEPARGYQPSQQDADYARALHGTCMFPHCDVFAWECDLDHRKPYNHTEPAQGGQTKAENLGPFCRKHHRLKTFGGWDLIKNPDGTLAITSPLGLTYPVATAGPIPLLGGTEPAWTLQDTRPAPKPKSRTRTQHHTSRIRCERTRNTTERQNRASEAAKEPPPF